LGDSKERTGKNSSEGKEKLNQEEGEAVQVLEREISNYSVNAIQNSMNIQQPGWKTNSARIHYHARVTGTLRVLWKTKTHHDGHIPSY